MRGSHTLLPAAWLLLLVLLLRSSPSTSPPPPPLCRDGTEAEVGACRLATIKSAVAHAWNGYAASAWGYDDVSPAGGGVGVENWHARSTLYDALDTLWLAGMRSEFEEVLGELRWRGPPMPLLAPTKLFEYNIRVVGGLLGA
jgi:mannosyl-oligosaccharide alpha-1,2-mannosidase